jgi:molecular chaperone GrpE
VIAKSGYKIGDRVVRAAQVLVVDPVAEPVTEAENETSTDEAVDPEAESDD